MNKRAVFSKEEARETKMRCLHEYAYVDVLDYDEPLYCDDCNNDFKTINGIDEENEILTNLLISRAEMLSEY